MAWLPEDRQGITPAVATAHYQLHNTGYPHYAAAPNQWADAIKNISSGVGAYLKQKNSDEIANTLLQQMGAPTELQGKGAAAYAAYQNYQNNQGDPALNDVEYQTKYAQMLKAQREAYNPADPNAAPKGKYPITLPDGRVVYVTGNAALRDQNTQNNQAIPGVGITEAQTKEPNYVMYQSPNPDAPIDPQTGKHAMRDVSVEDAMKTSGDSWVTIPSKSGKPRFMPVRQYNAAISAFHNAQGNAAQGGATATAPEQAVSGTSDPATVLNDARAAISAGAPPEAVKKRLQSLGIDPGQL